MRNATCGWCWKVRLWRAFTGAPRFFPPKGEKGFGPSFFQKNSLHREMIVSYVSVCAEFLEDLPLWLLWAAQNRIDGHVIDFI